MEGEKGRALALDGVPDGERELGGGVTVEGCSDEEKLWHLTGELGLQT